MCGCKTGVEGRMRAAYRGDGDRLGTILTGQGRPRGAMPAAERVRRWVHAATPAPDRLTGLLFIEANLHSRYGCCFNSEPYTSAR